MTSGGLGGEELREESSWRYPLAIFVATLALSAVFLYYYVGPSIDELSGNEPSPAISEEPIMLTVGDAAFSIPANYTVYPRDRRGGDREDIYLYALWSTFSGYTPTRRDEFVEDDPETRRIDITILERTSAFSEGDRIEKLFLPQTTARGGQRTPLQLLQYEFEETLVDVPTNGYAAYELFLGDAADGGRIAIFCNKGSSDLRSPACWREYELTDDVTVIYKFKRPYLQEWRNIDAQTRGFVKSLRLR